MADDPISAMNEELARRKAKRTADVLAFRKTHKVTDEQVIAMIHALAEGRATTLEEAWELVRK